MELSVIGPSTFLIWAEVEGVELSVIGPSTFLIWAEVEALAANGPSTFNMRGEERR